SNCKHDDILLALNIGDIPSEGVCEDCSFEYEIPRIKLDTSPTKARYHPSMFEKVLITPLMPHSVLQANYPSYYRKVDTFSPYHLVNQKARFLDHRAQYEMN